MYSGQPLTHFFASTSNKINFETNPTFGGANSSIALFRTIIQGAKNSPITAKRFMIDGDSQETSPGGQGNFFITLMAYKFWQYYGNIPESQMMAPASYGVPDSAAIMQAGVTAGAVAVGSTDLTRYPFYMSPGGDGSVSNRYTYNLSEGIGVVFQSNLLNTKAELTEISRTISYSDRTGLKFNFMVPYLADQGGLVRVRHTLSADGAPHYFNPDQHEQDVIISEAQVALNAWAVKTVDYDYGATPPTSGNLLTSYPQIAASGAAATPTTQVELGPHWFSSGNTNGIAITPMSKGGAVTTLQFSDNPNCMPFILAYNPDVIVMGCMVNDAGQGAGISAAQYKINVQAKIDTYLAAKPSLVFILMSDPDVSSAAFSAPLLAQFDLMPAKLRELALIPANRAVFIDRKKILADKYNWIRTGDADAPYLIDTVHFSLAGSRLVATEVVSAILTMGSGN